MQFDQELVSLVKGTAELYSKTISDVAATMFLVDLSRFDPERIKAALAKCRSELKSFPTVADVIARIDDGRPGVEEAWAMIPKDERDSYVWTDEQAEAFGVCRGMIEEDPIAARMAFKETYLKLVAESRSKAKPVHWTPSLGHDPYGRASAIQEAVDKKRLTAEQAQLILPDYSEQGKPKLKELPAPGFFQIGSITQKLLEERNKNAGEEVSSEH